ncbi:MAG: hypothetical protein AUG89_12330 [Acidobacteria bacterium 13_1_20CM_4_56_7]|nr:MAG: hypothetical protein AUG89_12330 [Acidobacteria bacterium 13_1_20CM_4_56_7]PYV51724.1 MAG: hypothetical protein DMG92_03445 [Acidobacteriota bacterium]
MSTFSMIGLVIALLAIQLDPALTPHRAPKPALPKIDENACPFEGCQIGVWTTREAVQLFSTWGLERKPVATIGKGEPVTAITGINITFAPSEIQVTAPIADYGLKPGDMIFGYMNIGEGNFNAWFNGYWVEQFDGSGITAPDGSGCRRKCNAKLLKPSVTEWWIKIKTKQGVTGWTTDSNKFAGQDALE